MLRSEKIEDLKLGLPNKKGWYMELRTTNQPIEMTDQHQYVSISDMFEVGLLSRSTVAQVENTIHLKTDRSSQLRRVMVVDNSLSGRLIKNLPVQGDIKDVVVSPGQRLVIERDDYQPKEKNFRVTFIVPSDTN